MPNKKQPTAPSTLFDGLPRGTSNATAGRVANAGFTEEAAIRGSSLLRFNAQGNPEGKHFFGVVGGEVHEQGTLRDGRVSRWVDGGLPVGAPDDRHVITIAGSRAGKGRSALIPNLLSYPKDGSVLVVDPKGDLARETAAYRAEKLGQQVAVLDPFGESGPDAARYAAAFNPLRLLTDGPQDALVSNANLIADALVVASNAKDPHWDDCSRDMIGGLCLHVATHEAYEGERDLVTVWRLAAQLNEIDPDDATKCRLETEMLANEVADGAVQAIAAAFYGRTGSEFSSVYSSLQKHLRWISFQQVRDTLRGDSIDLRQLKQGSMTVYVSLPAMQMRALSGWLRLVVQLSLAACESVREKPHCPVLFMLDEFHVLGRMECFETAVAQIAGFGVKLWFVLQDLGQLKKYDNWETFIANTGVIQAFGNTDTATLDYLSKKLGSTQVVNPSHASTAHNQAARTGATGDSFAIGSHPLLAPEEISRLFAREDRQSRQLVLLPGKAPLILQRVFHDKHHLFRGKAAQ